jgi:Peptidase family M23
MLATRFEKALLCAGALVLPSSAYTQELRPVQAVGKGEMLGYDPLRGYELRLQVRIRNVGRQPATITRAEVLLLSEGGWSVSQGESIARDGKFLGGDPVLMPGFNDFHDWRGVEPSPYTHWLLAVQVSVPGQGTYDDRLEIPYRRPGYATPLAPPQRGPVFIGLQEPLVIVELAGGDVWLGVVGQIINLSGKPLTLRRWHFALKNAAGKLSLDRDVAMPGPIERSTNSLHEWNSYDIGIFKNVNGQRVAFTGDPEKNENYFGWDQPIHCVEPGKVVVCVDTGFDNNGPKFDPRNAPLPQNCIWVEHAGGHLSCYYHIRQGSATVKVGQHVKAGQILARTGNSGNSPETHLHFGYLALDHHLGHYKNVPVHIDGLKHEDGRPAKGVPGTDSYVSTPAK